MIMVHQKIIIWTRRIPAPAQTVHFAQISCRLTIDSPQNSCVKMASIDMVVVTTAEDAQDTEEESPRSTGRGFSGSKDRWGFLNSDEFHKFLELPTDALKARKAKENDRSKKWIKMMKNWKKYSVDGAKHRKLNRRVRKGIPDAMRGYAWYEVCGAAEVKKKYPDPWKIDVSVVSETTIDEIGRDIDRTFPSHEMFYENGGAGQTSLRRVLMWYAALDPEVGYCQGMGFIAAMLLSYMVEEDAFYCFYAVLTRPSAPLRLLYLPKMAETQKVLHVFGELGRLHLGRLWEHLQQENIHHTMYFTEWALTLFSRGFSFDLVTRVWDVLMNEGSYKIVYRVSLALLKYFEKELLALKFDKIMELLRNLPSHVDAHRLMEITWSIPLKTEEVTRIEKEYEESLVAAAEPKAKKA